jgi:hypothetical protein
MTALPAGDEVIIREMTPADYDSVTRPWTGAVRFRPPAVTAG